MTKQEKKIHYEGTCAYEDGLDLSENPYIENSEEYRRWQEGWLWAQDNV